MRWNRWRAMVVLLVTMVIGVAFLTPLAGAIDPVLGGTDSRIVLASGRAYVLHVPPVLRRIPAMAEGRPAMIVLHGYRDDAAGAERSTHFDDYADRSGDLVAYPEGVRDSFNAGLCCGDAVRFHVDDVGFLTDVVRDLKARGAGRIAVVGFSNGGMMAYRFACARPELVDTVGVMSGTLEIPHCSGPITALHLHGLNDTAVPFTGERYSPLLRCFLRDVRTIPAAAPGSSITIEAIPGYPHRWTIPGDPLDATALFWKFARMDG